MRDELEKLELTQAVQGLRDQLTSSVETSNGQRIKFQVDEINLEFIVELRRDAQAKAGFKAWVISSDMQAGIARSSTHKVSVKLRPRDSMNGSPVEIGAAGEIDMHDFEP